MGDWKTVVGLVGEALAKGFAPNHPQEWLPFIEAYAYTGRWRQALDRSLSAWRVDHDLSPRLCQLWHSLEARSEIPAENEVELERLKARLVCDNF